MVDRTSEKALLSEREAAAFLNISPRHLWRLRQRGQIPYTRLGGRVLYPKSKLLEWIESQTISPEEVKKEGVRPTT